MSPLALTTGNPGTLDYDEFLREKVAFDRKFGFDVDPAEISPALKPHQAAIVRWAVAGGRRAIFAKFGLGESPLAEKTLARIAAGIARYWGPLVVEGAGNTYDATDPRHPRFGQLEAYYRAWPVGDPLGALQTTNTKALAVPVEGRDGKDSLPVDVPMRTQTTRAETALAHLPFIAELYGTSTARPVTDPAGTFTAGGNHHALVTPAGGSWNDYARPTDEALRTLTSREAYGLAAVPFILDRRFEYRVRDIGDPLSTITANDTTKALITRHNNNRGDQSSLTTTIDEWLRTLTTTAQQSIVHRPEGATAADLAAAREMLPDVEFRMFEPKEVAAGMAFPRDYVWQPPDRSKRVSKRDLVKAAGNAVCPPCSRDVVGVSIESMGVAA